MISYLSKPIASTVEQYHENVPLIAQVAQRKQSKYDNLLNTIFQKENQLLSLDTSANAEATKQKDNLLKIADEELTSLATTDLTIPENIQKVDNIFTPLLQNKGIMLAASVTQGAKNQAQFFEDWKKDGKGLYDSKNESYFWEQYAKNKDMSLEEFQKNAISPIATEFTDIDKFYRDSIKDLLPDVTMTIAPDGKGRIFTEKGKVISEDRILKMLPSNSKIIGQAEINAHYDYANVDQNQLLNLQRNSILREKESVQAVIDDSSIQVGYLNDQIKSIENGTSEGQDLVSNSGLLKEQLIEQLKGKIISYNSKKKDYQSSLKDYNTQINTFNAIYKPNGEAFDKILSEAELKNLKTSVWLANRKQQFAEAASYQEREITVKTDDIQFEWIKNQYQLNRDDLQHQQKMAEIAYTASLDPKKNGSLTIDTDGDGIPDVGQEDMLSTYGATPGDKVSNVFVPKKGEEYQSLMGEYGKGIILEKSLPSKTIEALKEYNPSYDEKKLAQDEEKFRVVLDKKTKDPNLKMTDKIEEGSEQTFEQFFKNPINKEIFDYITEKDASSSLNKGNLAIMSDIQSRAMEQATGDLNNIKVKDTPLVLIDDPLNSGHTGYKIVIPKEYAEKTLLGNLTEADYKIITQMNATMPALNVANPEKAVKRIISQAKYLDKNYSLLNSKYNYYKNEIAGEYVKGNLDNALYIKDINTAKSFGKYTNDAAIQYVKTQTSGNEKFDKKGTIEIVSFYKDPTVQSGWSVNFKASGTTTDQQGLSTKGASLPGHFPLMPDFVKTHGLNRVGDISEIERNLNQQEKGNPTKRPELLYTYMGQNFKFLKKDGGFYLMEMNPDNKTFTPLSSTPGHVDNLMQVLMKKRTIDLNLNK